MINPTHLKAMADDLYSIAKSLESEACTNPHLPLTYDPHLLDSIPPEITSAERTLSNWMKQNGHHLWILGNSCDRKFTDDNQSLPTLNFILGTGPTPPGLKSFVRISNLEILLDLKSESRLHIHGTWFDLISPSNLFLTIQKLSRFQIPITVTLSA